MSDENKQTNQAKNTKQEDISLEILLTWSPDDLTTALNNPEYKNIRFKIQLAQFILEQKHKDKIEQISSELISAHQKLNELDRAFFEKNYESIAKEFTQKLDIKPKIPAKSKSLNTSKHQKKNGFEIGD